MSIIWKHLAALLGVAIPCAGACGVSRMASAPTVSAPPAHVERPAPVEAPSSAHVPGARVLWRFHAGSTIHSAPVLDAEGTVYVGTGDGLLEAVDTSGALAWTYTLGGPVVESPVIDQEGHVIVATTSAELYSFTASGRLSWQVRTPARIGTGLSISAAWGLLFGGADGALWAYSSHASPLFHVPLGGELRGAPAPSGHRIWVGTGDGLVLLEGAARRGRVALGAAVECLSAALPDGSAVAVAGGALSVVGTDGTIRFVRRDVAWATTDGKEVIAVGPHGGLLRLDEHGSVLASLSVPIRPSAPPAVGPSGAIHISGESGNMATVLVTGSIEVVRVASSGLHRPLVDPVRHRVIVAAGEGTLAALPEPG